MHSKKFARVHSRLAFIVTAAAAVTLSNGRLGAVPSPPPPAPYQLVHAFSDASPEDAANGLSPGNKLVVGPDDALYGTATLGGADNCGTAFKVTADGTFTRLHEFDSAVDGCYPTGLLLVDDTFYGMTAGSDTGQGTIFSMTATGDVTPLHTFDGTDGANPMFPLIESCGVLFGTAPSGGANNEGVAFVFSHSEESGWQLDVLHHFDDDEGGPSGPTSSLLIGSDGYFYGTSFNGGSPESGAASAGTVYRMDGTGDAEVLASFSVNGATGEIPFGGLVQTGPTTFFGTTSSASALFGGGTTRGGLFKLETDPLSLEVIHSFNPDPYQLDGALPLGTLLLASDGNLYGTTIGGGSTTNEGLGVGTVFRYVMATETFEILHRFTGENGDPSVFALAGLTEGVDGKLYGTTGGTLFLEFLFPGAGTVYSFDAGIGTKTSQEITFNPLDNKVFGDADFTVSASSTSLLPVTFSAEGQCTVTDGLVHLTGVGSCTITASQAGDATYAPADSVMQSFDITAHPGVTLTIAQASVTGGTNANATVTIPNPAPAAGVIVTLTSDTTSAATVPATVTIPKGKTSKNFNITTIPVQVDTAVQIGASVGGPEVIQPLEVLRPRVTRVTLNPAAVVGGAPSTGTVTISGKAPTGGFSVHLESDNTDAATVGETVVVPAGATSATFAIATIPVGTDTPVGIGAATDSCDFKEAILTVKAASLSRLELAPASVANGASSVGTVTLNGPAPVGGTPVDVASSNTSVAQVTSPVLVPEGMTTATFVITTDGSGGTAPTPRPPAGGAGATVVSISASLNGVTKVKNLTVVSSVLASVTLNPATVKGGVSTTATVTLTAPAPAGGLLVTLTSDKPGAASSTSVTVAEGQTTASTPITTFAVTGKTTVKITGEGGGVTKTATLTVNK